VRKISCVVLCFCLIIMSFCNVFAEGENGPEIRATSAILLHEGSGRVFYEKNADAKMYPASTTKIMTALLAVENLDMQAVLTASETAIDIERDGSNIGILSGEEMTVEQYLYALLVASANDAANVLAEAVAGDIPSFVEKMNARAAELGMTGTHFMNAHGYHNENHYTTARDLAKLSTQVMEHDLIRQIVSTALYEIPPTNKYKETRVLSNSNSMVNPYRNHRYVYDGAAGIKTGHTSDAGACLVSYAQRDGVGLFSVVLNAPVEYDGNYSFLDTIALFNHGFNDFSLKTISDINEIVSVREAKWAKGDGQVVLSAKEPMEVLLPKQYDQEKLTKEVFVEEYLEAPVKKGDVLGRLVYFYDGEEVGNVDLIAQKDVEKSTAKMVFSTLWSWIFNAWVITPLAIIVAFLLLRRYAEAKKERKERERRRNEARRNFYR